MFIRNSKVVNGVPRDNLSVRCDFCSRRYSNLTSMNAELKLIEAGWIIIKSKVNFVVHSSVEQATRNQWTISWHYCSKKCERKSFNERNKVITINNGEETERITKNTLRIACIRNLFRRKAK